MMKARSRENYDLIFTLQSSCHVPQFIFFMLEQESSLNIYSCGSKTSKSVTLIFHLKWRKMYSVRKLWETMNQCILCIASFSRDLMDWTSDFSLMSCKTRNQNQFFWILFWHLKWKFVFFFLICFIKWWL